MIVRSILLSLILSLFIACGGGTGVPNVNNNNNNNNNNTNFGTISVTGADAATVGNNFSFNDLQGSSSSNTTTLTWTDTRCIIISQDCVLPLIIVSFTDSGRLFVVSAIFSNGGGDVNHGYFVDCLTQDCSTVNVDRSNRTIDFNNFVLTVSTSNSSLATADLTLNGNLSYEGETIPDFIPQDVNGRWLVNIENVPTTDCATTSKLDFNAVVQHSGNNISLTTPFGVFSGTYTNNTFQYSGSHVMDRGTLAVSDLSATLLLGQIFYNGTAAWSMTLNNQTQCANTTTASILANEVLADGGSLNLSGVDVATFNIGSVDKTIFTPYGYSASTNNTLISFQENFIGSHFTNLTILGNVLSISVKLDKPLDEQERFFDYTCTLPCAGVTDQVDKITFTSAKLAPDLDSFATADLQVSGELLKDPTKYSPGLP